MERMEQSHSPMTENDSQAHSTSAFVNDQEGGRHRRMRKQEGIKRACNECRQQKV